MTLRDVYIADLNHILEATRQKLVEWPVLAARVHEPRLRETFDGHYAQTRAHLAALEGIFERLDERPRPLRPVMYNGALDLWRKRLPDLAGEARELSLITAGLAADYHTQALYAEAVTAARALGDADGARTLLVLMNAEYDRTHRLTRFHDVIASRLAEGTGRDGWTGKRGWASEAVDVGSLTPIETDLESALAPSAATRRE
jgi:ferritin-like metal-binding protein YciE